MKHCGLRIDSANEFRCKTKDVDFNTRGSCHSCICQSCICAARLSGSTQWLTRAGDASKRRFLTGILVRCQSVHILQNIRSVLQVTSGKDFTYTRSRPKPRLPEDMTIWSSGRALDTKLLGMDVIETWDWFSRSHPWTKSNYLLGVLSLCDTGLLHMLGNLTSVLLVRAKRGFLQHGRDDPEDDDDDEDDVPSIPESIYSFNSQDPHPHLDLLIQAGSCYEPVDLPDDADSRATTDGLTQLETCLNSEHSKTNQPDDAAAWAGTEVSGLGSVSCMAKEEEEEEVEKEVEKEGEKDSDSDSACSEDPALMVVPRSSRSLSGVGRYRDFVRRLPVHLAKTILDMCDDVTVGNLTQEQCPLGLLDAASLRNCQHVSLHWRYLAEDTQEDFNAKKMMENQALMMQSNTTGVSSVYAKLRQVLVPLRDDEKHMYHGDVFSKVCRERGLDAVYAGVRTRAVQMEERNVYCGVYNVLVLLEKEDPHRVAHYSGGPLVAVGSKDRVVRLRDLVTLKEAGPAIKGHAGSIRALLLCEDRGLVISASYDLSIRCWNLKSGVCVMLFRGHQGTISCLDLHGNMLVSGAKDCKVKVWNLQTGKCYDKLKFKHHNPILCVKIDSALVVSGCAKGVVKMWSIETASLLKMMNAHQGQVRCLFLDCWHILSGGADGQVLAWSTNCDVKKSLVTYRHPREVLTLVFLFLRVITGCGDGNIRIFSFLSGDCLRVIRAGGQHSPVLSLHTHHNNMVVNTCSSVLLFQFARVSWDYSVSAERESLAERREREVKKEGKSALSHHARPLTTPSMRRAQAAQQQRSLRPATWSELQNHRRSEAYTDLQPQLIAKPPSARSPGGPAARHSRDQDLDQDQDSHSSTTRPSSARGSYTSTPKWVLTRSERAVRDRVKKRGPHHPVTPDHILLKVNAAQQPQRSDLAGANMELNARVRDTWGSSRPSLHIRSAVPPSPTPSPPALARPHLTGHAYSQLPPRRRPASAPAPVIKRLQTSCGSGGTMAAAVGTRTRTRKVGAFTTTAATDVRCPPPERMLLKPQPTQTRRRPGRHVDFDLPPTLPEAAAAQHDPLDPWRERGLFSLLTDTQLEEYARRAQASQGQQGAVSAAAHDQERKRRRMVWRMKVKGVSRVATDDTKVDQVYAPELGHDVYI